MVESQCPVWIVKRRRQGPPGVGGGCTAPPRSPAENGPDSPTRIPVGSQARP